MARCGACGRGTRKICRAQPQRKHRPGKAHDFDFEFSMMACTAIVRSAAPYWAPSGAANGGWNCFHFPDSKRSHAHSSLSSADTNPAAPAERKLWPLAHILFSLNRVSFSKANGSSAGGVKRRPDLTPQRHEEVTPCCFAGLNFFSDLASGVAGFCRSPLRRFSFKR